MRFLGVLIVALVLAASSTEAVAHASLVSVNPADGSVLAVAPPVVVLRFDEAIQPLSIRLVDDAGAAVGLPGTPLLQGQGESIRVDLPSTMREGTYVLSYRVASSDAHPVAGSIAFSIGRETSQASIEKFNNAPAWQGVRLALRALRDFALLIVAGGALFGLLVVRWPGERTMLVSAGAAAALLSLASIALHGAVLNGNGEVFAANSWHVAMHTSFGASGVVSVMGTLAIVVGALQRREILRKVLLASGALASAVSLSLTGHAASSLHTLLAQPALAIHVLAAAFWLASLIALFVLLRLESAVAIAAVHRFSRLALPAVALLIIAGTGLAVMQVTSIADLMATQYGNLILGKVALLAALLVFAAYNRFRLTPRLARVGASARQALRRSIVAELVVMVAMVAVTSVLVQTPPRSGPVVKSLVNGARLATLTVTPGHAGRNAVAVVFRDGERQPFYPVEVWVDLSNPSAGVEPISRKLTRARGDEYLYEGHDAAFPGSWHLVLRARIDDFEQVTWETTIDIR